MSNKLSVRHLIFYVSILIILVSFGYYTSYAFFSVVVEGNESATNTEVTLANIETTFETTSYINNERLLPILPTEVDEKAKKVEFIVTNTENSDIAIEYDIYLEDFLISDNFKTSEDLRYKITKVESGSEVLVAEGNFTESTSGENFKLTKVKETLNYNTSRDYILRLWIHDTEEEQPELLEGTISGRVSVIGKIYRESVPTGPKCRRAIIEKLHEEECEAHSYCDRTESDPTNIPEDYKIVDDKIIVTYGNQTYTEGILRTGDAFTCDVNGDGEYDEETERFYYVSDLYTGTEEEIDIFDEDYAVLLYYGYTRVIEDTLTIDTGIVNTGIEYSSSIELGPESAKNYLPNRSDQWKNITLKNETRQIYSDKGTTSTTSISALPQFNYTNKAARLLTTQEINKGCEITIGRMNNGELDTPRCRFLLENTRFTYYSSKIDGYWLETPVYSYGTPIWTILSYNRTTVPMSSQYGAKSGVRPAIEVLKTDISY